MLRTTFAPKGTTELPTQRSLRGTTPVLVGAFACPCSFVRMATRRLCSEALWLANTRYGSFGSPLGLVLPQDGGELRLRRLTATSSEVTMPYPAWAARPDNALCLPTALALADEISTFAGFALWDPRHRPGVSIALSGELVGHTHELPRVEPGEQPTR